MPRTGLIIALTIENEYCILSLVLDIGKLDDGMDFSGFGQRPVELEVVLPLQKLKQKNKKGLEWR